MSAAASRAAQAYRRVESQSRSPLELVVILYDGAMRLVDEGRVAQARNDLVAGATAISKTLAIIRELQNTLDISLCTYINVRLVDVTLKKDIAACDEVHKLLTTLREAWSQLSSQPPAESLAVAR